MHVILRIARYKGSFWSLLIGLLFMKTFLQVIDRPYDYLTGIPLLNATGGDYKTYTDIVYKLLAPIYFLVLAHFLFPLLYVVYKASRTITITAFTISTIIILSIASFIEGDFIISPAQLTQQRFDELMTEEQKAIDIYLSDVQPYLELGDKTGDYSKSFAGIDKCRQIFIPLIEECEVINSEIKGSLGSENNLVSFSDAQCAYFKARLVFYNTLEKYINEEVEIEEYQKSVDEFEESMDALNERAIDL